MHAGLRFQQKIGHMLCVARIFSKVHNYRNFFARMLQFRSSQVMIQEQLLTTIKERKFT